MILYTCELISNLEPDLLMTILYHIVKLPVVISHDSTDL